MFGFFSSQCCPFFFATRDASLPSQVLPHTIPIEIIKKELIKKGLVPERLHDEYAEITFNVMQSLSELNDYGFESINIVLVELNDAFSSIRLASFSQFDEPVVTGLDGHVVEKIKAHLFYDNKFTLKSGEEILCDNIFYAFYSVYQQMNKNRSQKKTSDELELNLTYHNPRHAAELFFDLMHLITHEIKNNTCALHVELLLPLCGLFHDVIFKNSRGNDEKASAKFLKCFLQPVMDKLSSTARNIISLLIDVFLVGGTMPAFLLQFFQDRDGQSQPVQISVCDLAEKFFSEKNSVQRTSKAYLEIMYFSRMISDVDIQRTSIPELNDQNTFFEGDAQVNAYWQIIHACVLEKCGPVTVTERKRLAQNIRVMCEIILVNDKNAEEAQKIHPDNSALVMAIHQQSEIDQSLEGLSETAICFLADKLAGSDNHGSEVNFSRIMHNTCEKQREESLLRNRTYSLENSWLRNIKILEQLYGYLKSADNSDKQKCVLINALAHIAVDQDGGRIALENQEHSIYILDAIVDVCTRLKSRFDFLSSCSQTATVSASFSMM